MDMKNHPGPGRETKYYALYRQLKEDILQGVLPPGARLPSKRTLSDEAGISIITVEHAYELLSDEGYILSRPKSRTDSENGCSHCGFLTELQTCSGITLFPTVSR